ncbi:MAG: protein-glutamate O-methyltransferase CheR [Gemmatimonadota bacterium]|nr:protein-glutamate O-methyltransferase CheR [Gemmatimonadota bacterium]
MTSVGADDAAFAALTAKIAKERGFGAANYRDGCLRRRIAVRMRARGVPDYSAYGALLDADPAEWEPLLDALTINVTKLFRDRDVYEALARDVVPAVWAEPASALRVWSAGCSSGEEPYSLAALFHRHATVRGEGDRLSRVQVLASDIDRGSLERARAASYAESAFGDTPEGLRSRYFTPGAPSQVVPDLRALVTFERRDLLNDPAPRGPFHLIACRNVVIYFDAASQQALFQRFHDALAPGGWLVLGTVETLLGAARRLFEAVDHRHRIFRRP